MFKILANEKANCDELAKAYQEIQNHIAGLKSERENIHSELVDAKRQNMAGASNSKTLAKLKGQQDDIDLEIEASETALGEIRSRIIAILPGEVETQIEKLNTQFQKILDEKKKKRKEYLELLARAAVVREEIQGPEMLYLPSKGEHKVSSPTVKWNPETALDDELNYFHEQGLKFRAESKVKEHSQTIDARLSGLSKELSRLRKVDDPAAEADRLIELNR